MQKKLALNNQICDAGKKLAPNNLTPKRPCLNDPTPKLSGFTNIGKSYASKKEIFGRLSYRSIAYFEEKCCGSIFFAKNFLLTKLELKFQLQVANFLCSNVPCAKRISCGCTYILRMYCACLSKVAQINNWIVPAHPDL